MVGVWLTHPHMEIPVCNNVEAHKGMVLYKYWLLINADWAVVMVMTSVVTVTSSLTDRFFNFLQH